MNNLPTISIIGRTNVGKSTLFNLFVKNKVITSRISGTTRDTNQQESEWQGAEFNIVDTGGIDSLYNKKITNPQTQSQNLNKKKDNIEEQIISKAKKAI
ncbi:50S ribosome-binding GTPase, partial [bacterium]|nr:50S ribosome-binding GTPase [bacterium]